MLCHTTPSLTRHITPPSPATRHLTPAHSSPRSSPHQRRRYWKHLAEKLFLAAVPLLLCTLLIALAFAEEFLYRVAASFVWFGAWSYMTWVPLRDCSTEESNGYYKRPTGYLIL